MATAELSKFAGILSAALSQHHLSGFGIIQLELVPGPALVSSDTFNEFSEQTYETVTVRIPILWMGKEFKQPTSVIGEGRLECGSGPWAPGYSSCILSAI